MITKKLTEFLNSHTFGDEVFKDYYGQDNVSGYKMDLKRFNDAKKEATRLLAQLGKITDAEIEEACKRAFMGRLEWNGSKFSYTAGQFYDIEVPQAVQAVLEYIKANRQ